MSCALAPGALRLGDCSQAGLQQRGRFFSVGGAGELSSASPFGQRYSILLEATQLREGSSPELDRQSWRSDDKFEVIQAPSGALKSIPLSLIQLACNMACASDFTMVCVIPWISFERAAQEICRLEPIEMRNLARDS